MSYTVTGLQRLQGCNVTRVARAELGRRKIGDRRVKTKLRRRLAGSGQSPVAVQCNHATLQPCNFARERGVALVITLILLSVITFMAVTFLVITQAERKSVTTSVDQLTAKQAAESAFQMAQIE